MSVPVLPGHAPAPSGVDIIDAARAAARARSLLATLVLAAEPWEGAPGDGGTTHASMREPMIVGTVTLLPHQATAVRRLGAAMDTLGGALLADETGLGKTYVALAIAAGARRPLVVAPAALTPMWAAALRRTGVRAAFRSTEGLSRAGAAEEPHAAHDLVIVDEAQHFRNPRTRRYDRLARLVSGARVLLLSATPVHNRAGDLRQLLALFAGTRAHTLDAATLARCVVRRGADVVSAPARPPLVAPLAWVSGGDDPAQDALLDAIIELPPPLPPRDGGQAVALLAHGLVRQWSSSIGALHGALRRRLVRAEALLAALDGGHHLSAAELRQWAVGDDAVQLPLPGLFDLMGGAEPSLRGALVAHRDGVRSLLRQAGRCDDRGRAAALRTIRDRHAGAGVVAFSQFADTVDALYRLLARDGGVCALRGDGARVAGGPLSRDDALRRFAPLAHGVAPPPAAERITLLLTTDVVSEGINLQDAVAVVHLDLPWTAARLEQRVGRVARLGSLHQSVAVYAVAPPARAERVLGVERRLRAKWREAGRTVGVRGIILPPLAPSAAELGTGCASRPVTTHAAPPERHAVLAAHLRRWRRQGADAGDADGDAPPPGRLAGARCGPAAIGALRSPAGEPAAFLAAVAVDGRVRLLGGRAGSGAASDDPRLLAALAAAVDAAGPALRPAAAAVDRARAAVAAWHRGRAASEALALIAPGAIPLQRRLLGRLARIVRATPLHQRPAILALATAARRALTRPLGAGGERLLAELVAAPLPDACWLRTLAAFADGDASHPAVATAVPERSPVGPRGGDALAAAADSPRAAGSSIAALLLLIPPGD
ncbi:MAG: helicase-related protein [Gemmatimonadaceae bacterium]